MFIRFILLSSIVTAFLLGQSVKGDLVVWEASSGLHPDEISKPFILGNSSTPEVPVLSSGVLTLSNDVYTEEMGYIAFPDLSGPLTVTTEMRVASGYSNHSARAPAMININWDVSQTGNLEQTYLLIFPGYIGLTSAHTTLGPTVSVDTTSDFHTYEVQVQDTGNVNVYYDGALKLTGSTYDSGETGNHVFFGDPTDHAYGVTEWKSFSYSAVPEPSSFLLIGFVCVGLVGRWSWKKFWS